MRHRKLNILKSLVLGLAVAAVAAPTALGEPRGPGNPVTAAPVQQSLSPDDRSLYRGSAQLEPQVVSLSPDDRAFYRGVESPNAPVSVIVSSSPDDRAFYRGVESPNAPVSIIVSSSSNDFRWTDASLGAGSTLAFILLLGAAALLIRHQRQRIAAY
ncbi:MAG TPA: hypothetical protein VF877_02550 [Gaiellaceae bacterium]